MSAAFGQGVERVQKLLTLNLFVPEQHQECRPTEIGQSEYFRDIIGEEEVCLSLFLVIFDLKRATNCWLHFQVL